MSGGIRMKPEPVIQWVHHIRGGAALALPLSTPSANGMSGCGTTHLQALHPSTSISRCQLRVRVMFAQLQIFWYTAFTASMVAPKSEGNNTVDDNGKPLWRMAPSPHGFHIGKRGRGWLSGCGFMDHPEINSIGPCKGCMALCSVRCLQDSGREEVTCWSDLHPRQFSQPRLIL